MRAIMFGLALILAACAGPPGEPWVLTPQHGGPTPAEQVTVEAEADPNRILRSIGQIIGELIGAASLVVLNLLLIGR